LPRLPLKDGPQTKSPPDGGLFLALCADLPIRGRSTAAAE